MLGALRDPVEIKLVGEGPDILAPLLIAGAALFAAAFAGYWQWRQLRHDREMRAREHIRDVLDTTIDYADSTLEGLINLALSVESAETERQEIAGRLKIDGETEETKEEVKKQLIKLIEKLGKERERNLIDIGKMHSNTLRLRLRFGNDLIVRSHDHLVDTLREKSESLAPAILKNRNATEKQATTEIDKKGRKAFAVFMVACQEWFLEGSNLTRSHRRLGLSFLQRPSQRESAA